MIRKILLVLLAIFVVMQAIRPKLDNKGGATSNAISQLTSIPEETNQLLRSSCYDCHSNATVYPWYSHVQPVGWWLDDHVNEGKRELNFDEFATYSLRKQYHKLEEIVEQVKEKEMPLNSYTWIHKDADLTDVQRQQLTGWADQLMADMKSKYPLDSLIKK
ncbi:MAG: heme-binding domain-containing protein [Flavipsychrobacter sp.]|nr:heme-binding domain-containing protein [Flavipsychrobacter sp.]